MTPDGATILHMIPGLDLTRLPARYTDACLDALDVDDDADPLPVDDPALAAVALALWRAGAPLDVYADTDDGCEWLVADAAACLAAWSIEPEADAIRGALADTAALDVTPDIGDALVDAAVAALVDL